MNRVRPFLTRAGWVTAVLALCALAFLVNIAAGSWIDALYVATLALLLVYGEAQHQRADDLAAQLADARDDLVTARLTYFARNPRTDWED